MMKMKTTPTMRSATGAKTSFFSSSSILCTRDGEHQRVSAAFQASRCRRCRQCRSSPLRGCRWISRFHCHRSRWLAKFRGRASARRRSVRRACGRRRCSTVAEIFGLRAQRSCCASRRRAAEALDHCAPGVGHDADLLGCAGEIVHCAMQRGGGRGQRRRGAGDGPGRLGQRCRTRPKRSTPAFSSRAFCASMPGRNFAQLERQAARGAGECLHRPDISSAEFSAAPDTILRPAPCRRRARPGCRATERRRTRWRASAGPPPRTGRAKSPRRARRE